MFLLRRTSPGLLNLTNFVKNTQSTPQANHLPVLYNLYRTYTNVDQENNQKIKKEKKPAGYWHNIDNQRKALDEIREKLELTTAEKWATVKRKQINDLGGSSVITRYRSIYDALVALYPSENWETLNPAKIEKAKSEKINLNFPPEPKGKKQKAPGKELMLSQVWNETIDPTGYWISEKFDGIRAFWSGEILASRYGNVLNAPSWWLDRLPKGFPIDGELWCGHDNFAKLIGIIRSDSDPDWTRVKLMAFDTPSDTLIFEERLKRLKDNIIDNDSVLLVPFVQCESVDHLYSELDKVIAKGGEGLMLRKPDATYAIGRSYNLLKVKRQQDAEVMMLRKAKKCVGFDCELPNGVQVIVRCTWTDYRHPPEKGTILRVKHFGSWDSGKLKNPYFWRIRNDGVTWNDLVEQYKLDHPEETPIMPQ